MPMGYFASVLLGIVQGLTEFLPISSSGHLVLAQSLIPGFSQPGVFYDVVLHLGTTLAVVFYFRRRIIAILTKNLNYVWLLLVGTIPAGLVGVLLGDALERTFSDTKAVGVELIITGILCFLVDLFSGKRTNLKVVDSLLVGMAQAVAIIPGISRSGSTIFAGTALGLDKEKIAEFSFLLSIPAIVGANILQFAKYGISLEVNLGIYAVGFIAAFVFGLISIILTFKTLISRNFKIFAVYCIILGFLVIVI